MNHRPFEDWLFADQQLTSEQERELRLHLRACVACACLSEANAALRRAQTVTPVPGFAVRFQARLTAHKAAQRRRTIWGVSILMMSGLALAITFASPLLPYLTLSLRDFFSLTLNYMVYAFVSLQAFGQVSSILVHVAADLVPLTFWGLAVLFFGGASLLWARSIRKFGILVQGA